MRKSADDCSVYFSLESFECTHEKVIGVQLLQNSAGCTMASPASSGDRKYLERLIKLRGLAFSLLTCVYDDHMSCILRRRGEGEMRRCVLMDQHYMKVQPAVSRLTIKRDMPWHPDVACGSFYVELVGMRGVAVGLVSM